MKTSRAFLARWCCLLFALLGTSVTADNVIGGTPESLTSRETAVVEQPPIIYRYGAHSLKLPAGSRPIEMSECNRSLVGRIASAKLKDVRTWKCLGYIDSRGSLIVLLKNSEKPSRTWGNPTWLFKAIIVEQDVRDLGAIDAADGLVPTQTPDGHVEILAITFPGRNANSDTPYSRYGFKRESGTYKMFLASSRPSSHTEESGNPSRASTGAQSTSSDRKLASADDGSAPNISDEFYRNQVGAITKYSSWRSVPFTFSEVSFINGTFLVKQSQVPASLERRQDNRLRNMNEGKGYWSNWFDAIHETPYGNEWDLTCIFPASDGEKLSKIEKGGTAVVKLKVNSASERRVTFDCKM